MKILLFFSVIVLSLSAYCLELPLPETYPSSQPSARIKGLADAGTAITNNPAAAFWNPAAAATLANNVLHISFANENNSDLSRLLELDPSINGKHISFLSIMTFQGGLSYHPLYSVSYADRYFPDDNYVGDLDVHLDEYILTLTTYTGANEKYNAPMFLGINLKYLNGRFAQAKLFTDNNDSTLIDSASSDISNGHGYGIDAGFLVSSGGFSAGISLRNMLTHIYWSGDNKSGTQISYDRQIIPLSATAGVSFLAAESFFVTIDVDRILQSNRPFIYRAGAEYTFLREINTGSFAEALISGSPSIRAGAQMKSFYGLEAVSMALGIGYSMDNFRIDMAFSGTPDQYLEGGLTYQLSANIPIEF